MADSRPVVIGVAVVLLLVLPRPASVATAAVAVGPASSVAPIATIASVSTISSSVAPTAASAARPDYIGHLLADGLGLETFLLELFLVAEESDDCLSPFTNWVMEGVLGSPLSVPST